MGPTGAAGNSLTTRGRSLCAEVAPVETGGTVSKAQSTTEQTPWANTANPSLLRQMRLYGIMATRQSQPNSAFKTLL